MTKLPPSMRLKVKRDTFFLPDPHGSVYFRNNVGSFRMEGRMIDQWVERLLPMFNGEYTLEELTDGLPDEYRDRVFEIAGSLFHNGFAQDASQERPHSLPDKVLERYGTQIEFLSNVADSGAYRFMKFRQSNVVAAGCGPFFVSLVAALLDSGLPKFHLLVTDEVPTNRQRLEELIGHARSMDAEVAVEELPVPVGDVSRLCEALQPFEAVLYVSQQGNIEELRQLQALCKDEGKLFLPAIFAEQIGLAGPLVSPDEEACWESMWRRLHQSAVKKDPDLHAFSAPAGAMLANVVAFEWLKTAAGVSDPEKNKVFLLDLETLEGNWHSFAVHPLVSGNVRMKRKEEAAILLESEHKPVESDGVLSFFNTLTSAETGIFHTCEEEDLKQLPLAQCCVQAADPIGDGPAGLLPKRILSGLTHEEARKEAGLTGIEAYASRLMDKVLAASSAEWELGPAEFMGVGAGETASEAVCRGIEACLADEWSKQSRETGKPSIVPVRLGEVEDERCRYYWDALALMEEAPLVGLGEKVFGFPVVWVQANGSWHRSVGLNVTRALRQSLQLAIMAIQNEGELSHEAGTATVVHVQETLEQCLAIPAEPAAGHTEAVKSALDVLMQHGRRVDIFELELEPLFKKGLAGVYGVLVRKEESR